MPLRKPTTARGDALGQATPSSAAIRVGRLAALPVLTLAVLAGAPSIAHAAGDFAVTGSGTHNASASTCSSSTAGTEFSVNAQNFIASPADYLVFNGSTQLTLTNPSGGGSVDQYGELVFDASGNAVFDTNLPNSSAGTQAVSLRFVLDSPSTDQSFTGSFNVAKCPTGPVASVEVTSQSGLTITATTTGSTDDSGTITSQVIDFGDGTTATTATATHTYAQGGYYTLTGTVKDSDGASSTATTNRAIELPFTFTGTGTHSNSDAACVADPNTATLQLVLKNAISGSIYLVYNTDVSDDQPIGQFRATTANGPATASVTLTAGQVLAKAYNLAIDEPSGEFDHQSFTSSVTITGCAVTAVTSTASPAASVPVNQSAAPVVLVTVGSTVASTTPPTTGAGDVLANASPTGPLPFTGSDVVMPALGLGLGLLGLGAASAYAAMARMRRASRP